MKITINDNRKIFAIREEFNTVFPYLKLDFFSKPNRADGPHSSKIINHGGKTIADCRTIHNSGEITISKEMTVAELEQRFADVYGLGIKIFRKSGKVWLETTHTDNWTLENQNKEGESLSNK